MGLRLKISLEGTLKPDGGIAGRITPEKYQETQILKGDTSDNFVESVKKLTLSKDKTNSANIWTIKAGGRIMKFDKNINFDTIKNTFDKLIDENEYLISTSDNGQFILYKITKGGSEKYGILKCQEVGNTFKFNYKTDGINGGNWINNAMVNLKGKRYLNKEIDKQNEEGGGGFSYDQQAGTALYSIEAHSSVKLYKIPSMINID